MSQDQSLVHLPETVIGQQVTSVIAHHIKSEVLAVKNAIFSAPDAKAVLTSSKLHGRRHSMPP